MGPALGEGEVLTQDALGMALAEDDDVVQAVATKRPHQTLADRDLKRRAGGREKASHPETTEPSPETRVVDAVTVVQQIARRRVADGLEHALRDPRARRMRGNTEVDDPPAVEDLGDASTDARAPEQPRAEASSARSGRIRRRFLERLIPEPRATTPVASAAVPVRSGVTQVASPPMKRKHKTIGGDCGRWMSAYTDFLSCRR